MHYYNYTMFTNHFFGKLRESVSHYRRSPPNQADLSSLFYVFSILFVYEFHYII